MSDMKTFTVRDLDRSPGLVLEASRTDGGARIRERSGRSYIIAPERSPEKRITALPAFSFRRGKLFKRPLSPELARQLDNSLAGE